MKITLVISALNAGGAQRILTQMANYWNQKGWEVTLLNFEDGRVPPFFKLDPGVVYRPLGISGPSSNWIAAVFKSFRRIRILREGIAASKPDAVISFIDTTNVLTLLATVGLSFPVIVSERTAPGSYQLRFVWKMLRKLSYRRADAIVVQSEGARSYFGGRLRTRTSIISNPVLPAPAQDSQPLRERGSVISTVGRLIKWKGHDLLLRAFGLICQKHSDWQMVIWGEGPERANLETLARQLGLENRVSFAGETNDTFEKLRESDLFVLSSRFEGFPVALCEAMSCGLPVISFDCPFGPREVIRQDLDGVLVPPENVDLLAKAMDRLISQPVERQRLASKAIEVTERFGPAKIMGQWEELLKATQWKR